MNVEIQYQGKPLTVHLTRSAETALHKRTTPLVAEMELYFSCMIRKRVRFHTVVRNDRTVAAADNLCIGFRPVMTEQCSIDAISGDEVGLTDFPLAKPAAYVPHWLRIDFRRGEWLGEFGYL